MNQCIIIAGPCKGAVIQTHPELPFDKHLRLPMKAKVEPYIVEGGVPSVGVELYVKHTLLTFKGNTAFYAPEGLSTFDVIESLIS